ncbi:MAG: carboxylating nicotinate-nucleotide diphosphorylase [Kiritimatiellae bacterium]|nr:carboxylating nicotinate-nucleotide diphosphorylase [Kiritimatiellia bacterium]
MSRLEMPWGDAEEALLAQALAEDTGPEGRDVTTEALVDADVEASAEIRAREGLVVSGGAFARRVFAAVDSGIKMETRVEDGERAEAGQCVLALRGPARGLLTGERTALNALQRMCGIATAAARMAEVAGRYGVRLLDTRKTLPGWRRLDKYAVACGGGTNHRMGLWDAVLIKDNHLAFWRERHKGSLADAVHQARERCPGLKIEVEVDTLEQLRDALDGAPDWVLLDNMGPDLLREAVAMCAGRCLTEASGGITADTLEAVAATGVTAISVGALTHSAKAADLGLDFL